MSNLLAEGNPVPDDAILFQSYIPADQANETAAFGGAGDRENPTSRMAVT